MGADGHIAFYDKLKVDRITKEMNQRFGKDNNMWVSFPGPLCDFRVNGQYCYCLYWEVGGDRSLIGWDQFESCVPKEKIKIWHEFEERCKKEAVLVEDLEVWT